MSSVSKHPLIAAPGGNMPEAFIIMQIGNPDLEKMCEQAIVPALKACGLEPVRIDKHNKGGLLKSEIIKRIQDSEVIVADLTNERPNCYLEVGYAMGIDKFRNLILTARQDHNQDNPDHQPCGPKIHFDLSGYDVLFWEGSALDAFRIDLEKRIRRRQAIIEAPHTGAGKWDENWFSRHEKAAREGLAQAGRTGYMEIRLSARNSAIEKKQSELMQIALESEIHTYGWPLALVMLNTE
jgi:hypothetical protein